MEQFIQESVSPFRYLKVKSNTYEHQINKHAILSTSFTLWNFLALQPVGIYCELLPIPHQIESSLH